jgi:hypothetical protein
VQLLLALTLILTGETALPEPTFAGKLPAGVDGGFAARLDSAGGQSLMTERGGMLVGFAFENGSLVPRCSLPLPAPILDPNPNLGAPLATGTIAATGDVDGDGLDEIVVAGSRTIRKYKLIRGTFALTAEAGVGPASEVRSAWCFDVCIGDVNSDGVNEVMLSGIPSPPPFEQDEADLPITLCVCRWVNKDLAVIWDDGGTLKLEGPSWVMPITQMRCVCDPANSGHARLLMEEGVSDVRAGTYDDFVWDSAGLHKDGYFNIRDGRIQRNVADENPESSAVRCDFARVGGATAILASVLIEEEYSFRGEYFVFHGDTAAQHRVLWAHGDLRPGIIIDPDGNGPGVLRFMYPRPKEVGQRFEFYRL